MCGIVAYIGSKPARPLLIEDGLLVLGFGPLVAHEASMLMESTQQNIIELPLNGRNAAALVLLAPGTSDLNAGNARGKGDTIQTASYPGAQSISSNGARNTHHKIEVERVAN